MSTLQIPSFLDLTLQEWSPSAPFGAPAHHGPDASDAAAAALPSTALPSASPRAPADAVGPMLLLRPMPDGRAAFALRSKLGATLVSGASQAHRGDWEAFGRQVLALCGSEDHLRVVASNLGQRLEIGGDAHGLVGVSRPAAGAAHTQALRRLIAIQAGAAAIHVERH